MRHPSIHRTSDASTITSAGQHDYHFRLEQASSPVSSPAQIDISTRANVFHGTDDNRTECIVTIPSDDTNERNNASTFDIVCPHGKGKEGCMGTNSGPDSLVITVISRIQLVLTCAGFFANAATFVPLTLNGGRFSPLIRLLLKHLKIHVHVHSCSYS